MGTPTAILFANKAVVSAFLCSIYESARTTKLANGRAIINPASSGFLPDSQLAKAIMVAAKTILKINNNIYNLACKLVLSNLFFNFKN